MCSAASLRKQRATIHGDGPPICTHGTLKYLRSSQNNVKLSRYNYCSVLPAILTLPAQRGRVLYCISFFLLSSYPARAAGQGLILHQFLSSFFFFFLLLLTLPAQRGRVLYIASVSFFFLHSRSLRLCISSVRFLSSSSVNTSKSYISDMT